MNKLPQWVLVALILLIVGSWSMWDVYIDYDQVMAQEYRLLEVRARQREASIAGSLRSVNLMLGSLIDDIHERPDLPVKGQVELLKDYMRLLPELRNILIEDATGRVLADGKNSAIGMDASQREYFKHHLEAPLVDAFHLSKPFKAFSGAFTMTLSRSMHDNQGHFQGIVVASIDTAFFVDALKLAVSEPGVEALLINRQGDVIARGTGSDFIDQSLAGGVAYTQHVQSGQRTTQHLNVTKIQAAKKMAVFHDLADAPLTVIVSREYDSLLSQWRHSLLTHIAGFLVLAGTTLVFSWLASRRLTALLRERQRVAQSELELRTIIETEPECVKQLAADGSVLQMNRAGLDMIEADTLEQVLGKKMQQMVLPAYREDFMKLTASVFAGERGSLAFRIEGLKGGQRWLETHAVPMRDLSGQVQVLLAVTRDITANKQMEDEVRQLAFFDPLTALPNRRLLLDRMTQVMAASKRSGKYAAVLFLDLDNFKPLNDQHGHDAGDQLLKDVARRLKACIRQADTVARFGGDEFVVMLGELSAEEIASTAQALGIAEKIRAALMETYALTIRQAGKPDVLVTHDCSASIGVTLFLGQNDNQEVILQRGDEAMYSAKNSGRNRVCRWSVQA